jgi:hypothetical protein
MSSLKLVVRTGCGVLFVVTAFLVPSKVAGQQMAAEPMNCDFCMPANSGTAHEFMGTTCAGGTSHPDCFDCHAFNACHSNVQAGPCGDWHWSCGRTALGDEVPMSPEMWDNIARLAELGQMDVVEQMARENSQIVYNRDRNVVQLLGCTGVNVVAQAMIGRATTAVTHAQIGWVGPVAPSLTR